MSSAPAPARRGRTSRAGRTGKRQQMLAAVYDQHGAAVFGLAERITGDAAVAATLTAATFDALEHVTNEATLQACMLVDVHRRAVAWRRDHDGSGHSSGTAAFVREELHGDERDLVAATYFGGLTYRDVAALLGRDGSEVAGLLQRGLERLHDDGAAA